MSVKLIWITPDPMQTIADCARVSNDKNRGTDGRKLLNYLIDNHHWSPLEMASACIEINTTRDVARQILRHRSFSFQEFSQRYAEVTEFSSPKLARLQDEKNRQASIPTDDESLQLWWAMEQKVLLDQIALTYKQALQRGIAKEVARVILPEGLTLSKMYMTGTIRSWVHYINLRSGNGTQPEHKIVAEQCKSILAPYLSINWEKNNKDG